jgi:hypothetical protein
MKSGCRWILQPALNGQTPVYCDKPTGYHYELDDDQNKFRKQEVFCREHLVKFNEQTSEEE